MMRRVPFIPQAEIADCGVVCLAMVLRAFGRYVSCDELRRRASGTSEGITAYQLVSLAREQGLEATAFRLDATDLNQVATPAILHWEGNHFVVLERAAARNVRVIDPRIGRRALSAEQVTSAFSGLALEFQRTSDFVERAVPWRSLVQRTAILGLRAPLAAFAIMVVLLAVHASGWPWLLYALRTDAGGTLPLYFAVIAVELTRAALTWVRDARLHAVRRELRRALDQQLHAALDRQPLAFFERRHPSVLADRVVSANAACELVLQAALAAAGAASIAAACFATAFLSHRGLLLLLSSAAIKVGLIVTAPRASDVAHSATSAGLFIRMVRQLLEQYDAIAWIALAAWAGSQLDGEERGFSCLALLVLQALVLRRLAELGETIRGFGEIVRRVAGLWDVLDVEKRS